MNGEMFPAVAFSSMPVTEANALVVLWEHKLGACRRPFGMQAFGLLVNGKPACVAISASTVNRRCAGYERGEVVELARLCSDPDLRWATRVGLRLWRETAPAHWAARYWPVRAVVSYANTALGHRGDIYRFDGWRCAGHVRGGTAGGNWSRGKRYDAKTIWVYARPDALGGGAA